MELILPVSSFVQGSFKEQEAILKRLTELLDAKRERLQLYLEVLRKQRGVIEHGGVEHILAYTEAGEKLTLDILAIQRVVEPLEKNASPSIQKTKEIENIKKTLENLTQEVRFLNEENKALLSKRMALLAAEIKSLEASPLRERTLPPSYVDISI
jgi:flagellar biosynthesis/type III secretory pathway chaperone